jgi:hypothetical protein
MVLYFQYHQQKIQVRNYEKSYLFLGHIAVDMGPLKMDTIDLGGSLLVRRLWHTHLKSTELKAIVYVIDASDSSRFAEAKQVLHVRAN